MFPLSEPLPLLSPYWVESTKFWPPESTPRRQGKAVRCAMKFCENHVSRKTFFRRHRRTTQYGLRRVRGSGGAGTSRASGPCGSRSPSANARGKHQAVPIINSRQLAGRGPFVGMQEIDDYFAALYLDRGRLRRLAVAGTRQHFLGPELRRHMDIQIRDPPGIDI